MLVLLGTTHSSSRYYNNYCSCDDLEGGGGYINTQVLVKYHLSIDIYIGIYTMILTNYMLVLQAYSSLGNYEFHHILITYALLLLEY